MNPAFNALELASISLDMVAAQRATPDGIAARQRARLARLVARAGQGSALYRQRLRGIDSTSARLEQLPIVTKDELMQRFDDWVCDPALRLDPLRAFCADPLRIAEPYLGRYVVWESSGSSGQSGVFVQDARSMAVCDGLEALRRSRPALLQSWFDPLGLNQRMAFVGATSGHFASYVSLRRLCRINPWIDRNLQCFSILQPVAELVGALNRYAPTVLATYPSVAALLADEAARGALEIAPREVWTGGETLSPTRRERIERSLGCTLRNNYGASEFLSIGWECDAGGLHANADWVILEPADAQLRPVPVGELSASVLLTNLANTVQPLIRYDLGDQVRMLGRPCGCGSPLPLIEVAGRCDDTLTLQGRDGRTGTVLPLGRSGKVQRVLGRPATQAAMRSA